MGVVLVTTFAIGCILPLAIAYPNLDYLGNTTFQLRFFNSVPGRLNDFGRSLHTIETLTGVLPEWQSEDNSPGRRNNLLEVAKRLNLTKLVEAVTKVGLHRVLNHEGPFTLFAPTNEAFDNVPGYCSNVPLLDVIKYHVALGSHKKTEFKNNVQLNTLLTGRRVRVNIYPNTKEITASGRSVSAPDNIASNGVLHVLSGVMCALYKGNAAFELQRCSSFSMLNSFINKTDLYNTLNDDKPLTVFAPTDSAFAKLSPDLINDLKNNVTALKEVLLYHVVPDVWYAAGLSPGQLKTLQGQKLTVDVDAGAITVNDAAVVLPDATVGNGVVHAIDTVLLPKLVTSAGSLFEPSVSIV
ncbi:unnamed protein product [Ixodes hexagonus]